MLLKSLFTVRGLHFLNRALVFILCYFRLINSGKRYKYIKRIIGILGDNLRYINKQWIINSGPVPQQFQAYTINDDGKGRSVKVERRLEKLNGQEYSIYIRSERMA